jgi:hypothetical protein
MIEPWAEAGYRCLCVDLSHPEDIAENGLVTFIRADVRNWLPPLADYRIVFAAPPCNDLPISRARYFSSKGPGRLAEALAIVDACRTICEWSKAPWMLENPFSTLSTCWRQPDFCFDPSQYGGCDRPGDAYSKRTCLWAGGGFHMPTFTLVTPGEGSRMLRLPPTDDRAAIRSATPLSFARAVFRANCRDPGLAPPPTQNAMLTATNSQTLLPCPCHD